MSWQLEASCGTADPALFDEHAHHPTTRDLIREGDRLERAQRYCTRCPVTVECLRSRMRDNASGVAAGMWLLGGKPWTPHGVAPSKLCTRCGIRKPRSQFHRDDSRGDGLTFACGVCRNRKPS